MHMRQCLLFFATVVLIAGVWIMGGCGGNGGTVVVAPGTSQTGEADAGDPGITRDGEGIERSPFLVGFRNMPGPAEEGLMRAANGEVKYTYQLIPAIAVSLPPQAVDALARNPQIEYIEPDGTVQATAETIPWGISRVKADQVWPLGYTGTGVKLAILDTGIDYTHSDLAPNYQGGYDFVNSDNDPMDDDGHGTHVAGTAAAVRNDLDVAGVAPDASLYALKVLDADGYGYYSDIILALEWSVANDMQVANMSFGGNFGSSALEAACDATYSAGVILVAAAGNDADRKGRRNTVDYPARYASVIAVAATDENDERASFSSTGDTVELAAPGVHILSDLLGGGTDFGDGTSMSCPHVSGAAVLVIASGVSGAATVRDRLDLTALDLGPVGVDTWYGYGLVDIYAAVTGSPPPPPPPPPLPPSTGTISGKVLDAVTGKGINGATVSVDTGQSDMTNPSGRYRIEEVPSGSREVTASAPEYTQVLEYVVVYEGETTSLNFALMPN